MVDAKVTESKPVSIETTIETLKRYAPALVQSTSTPLIIRMKSLRINELGCQQEGCL